MTGDNKTVLHAGSGNVMGFAALNPSYALMRHATQRKYEYRHKWRHGDWVMWDNRSVMHQANADYDMNERRYLYRLMLKGEVPA
jgi:taurine dioxygenase